MVYEVCETHDIWGNEDWLAHHGIVGQKWHVRRFQNPDGTLTAAGKARYGKGEKRRNMTLYDPMYDGERREARLRRRAEKASDSGDQKRSAKLQKKADAQAEANKNLKEWENRQTKGKRVAAGGARTVRNALSALSAAPKNPEAWINAFESILNGAVSTGALSELTNLVPVFDPVTFAVSTLVDNVILTPNYRHARARGSGVVRSFLESSAGLTPVGTALRVIGDKQEYGSLTWFS